MEITQLLQRAQAGDDEALNTVVPWLYLELKKLAAAHLRHEGKHKALETTALVHEAYIRMAQGRQVSFESRSHFFGIASRLMRQILVDAARARLTQKRNAEEVCITDLRELGNQPDASLLHLDETLERMSATDALKVQLIEMRYFGGMTAEESAQALSMSVHVVRRELRLAQAWLHKELTE